ncbi:MAG: hypothetical protein AB2L14_19640 [Candidatus Xenobiia bacterium LiM19]
MSDVKYDYLEMESQFKRAVEEGDVSSKPAGVEGSHTGSCRSCPSPLSAVSADISRLKD